MSDDATTMAVLPCCNPDEPPENFRAYPRDFDMDDTREQLAWWPLLQNPLEICAREVVPAYKRADAAALRHQDRHRKLANLAALFGTAAVLLAIFQLAFQEIAEQLGMGEIPTLETVSALAAFIAVVLGLLIAIKARWLLERHKAERLRLLKFHFLLDPDIWREDDPVTNTVTQLRDSVAQVSKMTAHDFREWVEELGKTPIPAQRGSSAASPQGLAQLVDYYRAKRLVYQRVYFENRKRRMVPLAWLTGWLAPLLFFCSVASVLVHFVVEHFVHLENSHEVARLFIFLAAALPTVGAGIRTLTAANEFARNKVRYHAKEAVLIHVDEHLKSATDADARIRHMEFCEQTLEMEHREWARLMIETEVFP
jgi:hypothetical protein